MGPSEIQELLDSEPFVPLRLTLSSGSVVELHQRESLNLVGLSLSVLDDGLAGQPRLRFISIPNIAMAEPIVSRHGREGL